MPSATLIDQLTFEDMMLFDSRLLKRGSVKWLLQRHRGLVLPEKLFEGWGDKRLGRDAIPAVLAMGMLVLRFSEPGITRVGSVERAAVDATWRAALGLLWRFAPPSESTLRRFEAFMKSPSSSPSSPPRMLSPSPSSSSPPQTPSPSPSPSSPPPFPGHRHLHLHRPASPESIIVHDSG